MSRVLIAGCGYVGSALAEALAREGDEVWTLRRSEAEPPAGAHALQADLNDPDTLTDIPDALDHVVFTAAPGRGADEAAYQAVYIDGLRTLLDALEVQMQWPRRIIFASSSGVYGQSDGEWVDETSTTNPEAFTGRLLVEAERRLLDDRFRATAVRFGGIYGPDRTMLVDGVRDGRARLSPESAYTNRIHRDDCVGVIRHLMGLEHPLPIYVAVDSEPAPRNDVLCWLAETLGVDRPASDDSDDATAGDRGGANKRCSNKRLIGSGFEFRYPTYREGYRQVLDAHGWLPAES